VIVSGVYGVIERRCKTPQANENPLYTTFSVPDVSRFFFSALDFFELSNVAGAHPAVYDFYVLEEDAFTADSEVLGHKDISKSGTTLIYRRSGILDWECPGLFELRMGLHGVTVGRLLRLFAKHG
jgi:hypothetical protein